MRFLTDDGLFGVLVGPVIDGGQSQFQLVIGGRLIGASEVSFAYGAFEELQDLPRLTDPRLALLSEEPDVILAALLNEEELHDPATLSLTESSDDWMIQGYIYEGNVVMVARPYRYGTPACEAAISVVGCDEYAAIITAARRYYPEGVRPWRVRRPGRR